MKTYYLIDFENVNSRGLAGSDKLGKDDYIYIIFTHNSCKLDMSFLSNCNANIRMIEVAGGKQSLDMHLASYVGYFAGQVEKCNIVIISRDNDYNSVIKYWKDAKKISVTRRDSISGESGSTNSAVEQKKDEVAIENEQLRKIIKATPHDKKFKHAVYTQIIKKYGQKAGLELYNSIKPQLKQM